MQPFRREPWFLAAPSDSFRYLTIARFYAFGMIVHLGLPEVLEPAWLPADAVAALGALVLAVNGALLGWTLALIGTAIPLIFYGDVLTQSLYLASIATCAIASFVGPAGSRSARLDGRFVLAVRGVTIALYALAALHKTNAAFLSPATSCATAGVEILAANWSLPELAGAPLGTAAPYVFLTAEAVAVLLLATLPRVALPWLFVLHVPLTVIFAPAFAFVVMPGWIALLTGAELRSLFARSARHAGRLAMSASGPFALDQLLYFRDHHVVYPLWIAKEWLLLFGLAATTAWTLRLGRRAVSARPALGRLAPKEQRLAITATTLMVANGLTPYFGLQYHHAGAMLSNLRIDGECWNSLLVPRIVRIDDPYIDVTVVRAEPPTHPLAEYLRTHRVTPEGLRCAASAQCAKLGKIQVQIRSSTSSEFIADLCGDLRPPASCSGPRTFPDVPHSCLTPCAH